MGGDLFAWSNDLISLEKEMQDDEGLNLVLVILNERKCSIEDAFDEAVQMYNARVEEFVNLYNDIPDFGIYTPVVKKFLEGQGGYLKWFEEIKRYNTIDSVS
ncbi:terpene synthase family protein [Chryseobacterium herbae]|uniref:Terpene synthase family protein n=1 Tax=Chryseobacterium herbae TaxID=2976476 RepID=A0ABT2IXU3_9FLAO|nr:terpene synthase family protein [Chryseobacterium sp. pc1-10]